MLLSTKTSLCEINRRRHRHHLTPYSRFGAFAPRSGPEFEVDSGMQFAVARKHIQPDTPAPPNRVAAVPLGLKVVGRREYQNVRRNHLLFEEANCK
jgi:hypothetical protein